MSLIDGSQRISLTLVTSHRGRLRQGSGEFPYSYLIYDCPPILGEALDTANQPFISQTYEGLSEETLIVLEFLARSISSVHIRGISFMR